MLSRPIVPLMTLVMSAGLALGGCGSDSPSNTDGGGVAPDGSAAGAGGSTGGAGGASTGGSGGAATGGAGGAATGGSGGAAGGAGGMPNLGGCGSGNSGNACTKTEMDSYNQCLISKCASAYRPCLGDNFQTGVFGGLCGAWFQCINKCGCNDLNCFVGCGQPSMECQTCLTTASSCQMSMCPQPACYTQKPDGGTTFPGGDAGAGGSCADLLACCAKIADANIKAGCMAAAGGGEAACGQALAGFKSAGICQ